MEFLGENWDYRKNRNLYNNFPLITMIIKCFAVVRGLGDDLLSFFCLLVFEIASHHVALELAKLLLHSPK